MPSMAQSTTAMGLGAAGATGNVDTSGMASHAASVMMARPLRSSLQGSGEEGRGTRGSGKRDEGRGKMEEGEGHGSGIVTLAQKTETLLRKLVSQKAHNGAGEIV